VIDAIIIGLEWNAPEAARAAAIRIANLISQGKYEQALQECDALHIFMVERAAVAFKNL
jgi:hypothetical protein